MIFSTVLDFYIAKEIWNSFSRTNLDTVTLSDSIWKNLDDIVEKNKETIETLTMREARLKRFDNSSQPTQEPTQESVSSNETTLAPAARE